jgi:hypothetical protein
MALITTPLLKIASATQFLADATSSNNSYYVTLCQPQGWIANTSPPAPVNSPTGISTAVFDSMILGKQISNTSIVSMIPRYDWTANTVYAMYDDQDANLYIEKFFVTVDSGTAHYVFKCLDNAGGAVSTIQPDATQTSASDEFYKTSDGYRWKYMFTVSNAQWAQFATSSWLPVFVDAAVTGNAVSGSIDNIIVVGTGSQYNSYANGTFKAINPNANGDLTVCTIDPTSSANANFYTGSAIKVVSGAGVGQQRTIVSYATAGGDKICTIDHAWNVGAPPNTSSLYQISPVVSVIGDGSGLVARALINPSSNTISSIEITSRGQNYSYATATVTGNTGIVSTQNAILRPIISPSYGHGGNLLNELGGTAVGLGISVANNEAFTVPDNGTFAQVALLKNPLWQNVSVVLTSITGIFVAGEIVQVNGTTFTGTAVSYNAGTSTLVLTSAGPGFVAAAHITGLTSSATATISTLTISGSVKTFSTFDQRLRMNTSLNGGGPFNYGDVIAQAVSNANAVVQFANTTFTAAVQSRGTFANTIGYAITTNTASANVATVVQPDLIRNAGQVLYVENVVPVTRATNSFKFVISF